MGSCGIVGGCVWVWGGEGGGRNLHNFAVLNQITVWTVFRLYIGTDVVYVCMHLYSQAFTDLACT